MSLECKICPFCGGTGQVYLSDMNDQVYQEECSTCYGTGREMPAIIQGSKKQKRQRAKIALQKAIDAILNYGKKKP